LAFLLIKNTCELRMINDWRSNTRRCASRTILNAKIKYHSNLPCLAYDSSVAIRASTDAHKDSAIASAATATSWSIVKAVDANPRLWPARSARTNMKAEF
jgi:hypothetical protein